MEKDRIFGLDVLRAAAISMVVFGHIWWLMPDKNGMVSQLMSLSGYLGVELFFVLSGFLIGAILLRMADEKRFAQTDVLFFLKRRWLRTLPNYYLILILHFILAASLGWNAPDWRYFFFLQNFASQMPVEFTESWSLSVEEFAYLVLPMLGILLWPILKGRKAIVASALAMVFFSTVCRMWWTSRDIGFDLNQWNVGLKSVVVYRLDAIAYGVLMAAWKKYLPEIWEKMKTPMLFIGLALLGFLAVGVGFLQITADRFPMFWGVLYLPLASFAFCCFLPMLSGWKEKPASGSFVEGLSRISYALYLVHYGIVLHLLEPLSIGFLPKVILYLASSVVAALILYRFFENPWLKWRNRLLPDKPKTL